MEMLSNLASSHDETRVVSISPMGHIACSVQRLLPGEPGGGGSPVMLISRCAWHPRYQGHPLLHGIASWRGFNVRFTDGICEKCLVRFRAEHRTFLERPRPSGRPPVPAPHQAA